MKGGDAYRQPQHVMPKLARRAIKGIISLKREGKINSRDWARVGMMCKSRRRVVQARRDTRGGRDAGK